jgi:hypothetical protein
LLNPAKLESGDPPRVLREHPQVVQRRANP